MANRIVRQQYQELSHMIRRLATLCGAAALLVAGAARGSARPMTLATL